MNSIDLINPIIKPAGAIEVSAISALRSGNDIAIVFESPVEGEGFNLFMSQEVFDKLAVAVVRFVQNEAVKSQQEKKA